MPIALVTGSNRGIGLALCRALAARGDSVIGACREPSPELSSLGVGIDQASTSPMTPRSGLSRTGSGPLPSICS